MRHAFGIVLLTIAALAACRGTARASKPVAVQHGERIALVGGGLAPRMAITGHFESLLHSRFPDRELVVRNFGWPADEAGLRMRPNDYTALGDPLKLFAPTLVLCFFGTNEAFAGPENVAAFAADLEALVVEQSEYLAHDGRSPRFVFISPAAFEDPANASLNDGGQQNRNLALYTQAMRETAAKLDVPFVDVFTPTLDLFAREQSAQFTTNGLHVNEAGELAVAAVIDLELFGSPSPAKIGSRAYERLRRAVIDKAWHHQQDYRIVNGWYVYGGRNAPFGVVNFPEEIAKLRRMVAKRDRHVWALVKGEAESDYLDDADTGELTPVASTFGTKTYSEPDELRYLTTDEALAAMEVADGYAVQTFASETAFPELANPVQINFDNRGRLWAACMPTYPQWRPGDAKPNDRLLIFQDDDRDGVADQVKVFADGLHVPTGFEFWNGGVLVVSQPQLLFLKDTDGDDRADVREIVFDGFASDDTHHAIGAFEWTPGGELIMLEGISMTTTLETPWGPFRNQNRSVAYRFDPRTLRIDRHITPCFANPWCYTHNDWGQGFVGDGTGAVQHWATPLSGKAFDGRKGTDQFIRYTGDRMRPALGNEFISSRHFRDDAQGNFLYACVINMNGILQFKVDQRDSGYAGYRVTDIVRSSDRNFRPADPQIGPDGALYFGDWHEPLIGHMQYSQRDPNRDHRYGRIYRLSAVGREPLVPVTQAGKMIGELLDQLDDYETRTRDRARRELRDRDMAAVARAIAAWTAELDPADPLYDRRLTEALWVEQAHHAVDGDLLTKASMAKTADVRAAAAHVIADEHERLGDALARLRPLVHDEHPRVRLEAVRALSFIDRLEAVELALEVLDHKMDYYLTYTLESTLGAQRPLWKPVLDDGRALATGNLRGQAFLTKFAAGATYGVAAHTALSTLTGQPAPSAANKQRAIRELAQFKGDAAGGAKVFERTCVACHKVGTQGAVFGPNLSDAGLRLKREEIIESILEPNAKLDPKYQTMLVLTVDGKIYSGLIVEESSETTSMLVGAGKLEKIPTADIEERQKISVSSMPERLHETLSGEEFVDLLEFLASQRAPQSPDTPAKGS